MDMAQEVYYRFAASINKLPRTNEGWVDVNGWMKGRKDGWVDKKKAEGMKKRRMDR